MNSTEAGTNRIDRHSTPEVKIALFRSYFRGREDVYPLRFENKRTGKSGYAPACANEWVPGICEKPRIKCALCPHRKFREVTEDTLRWHLMGADPAGKPFVMGVYPMLLDESCFFLALDLDGEQWRDDIRALKKTCDALGIPALVERSRSGDGAHLWIFFAEAIPAATARKLGALLITRTMEEHPVLGFASYDRMFPNQDTLPSGGFGNLIALPLQAAARSKGNSTFLDADLEPIDDPWEHLFALRRMERAEVETRVAEAEAKDLILGVPAVPDEAFALAPWKAPPSRTPKHRVEGPLPERLTLVLGDQIYLRKEDLPPALRNRLLRLAAFQNPAFYKAQAMRLPTRGIPRIIACAEEFPEHIALPRGCFPALQTFLAEHGIAQEIRDERQTGSPLELSFKGTLRPDQQKAAAAILAEDTGVLCATTAFGKTVLAAHVIAQRKVNTLVLVHRAQLMEQWVERLTEFLDVDAKDIGRLGGGRRKLKGRVDIALLQSVSRNEHVDDRLADYGQIIVDECHHVPAQSMERALRRAKAKYVLGLTATITRKDGHQPIVFMQCGPLRHQVDASAHAATSTLDRRVIVRPTSFQNHGEATADLRAAFVSWMDKIQQDEARNRLVCEDVRTAVLAGASPLVLTERTQHVERLAAVLRDMGLEVCVFVGGMGKAELREAGERLRANHDGYRPVMLATGRFVGEGFDEPRLDSLFLAMPVSWRGLVTQYVGRLHRMREGKSTVTVYDYCDLDVPMLAKMFERRRRTYEKLGYSVLVAASFLPGWPQDVPLPMDALWKERYSASVQRLTRDGVDSPLAKLFVDVADIVDKGSCEGADRARSAAEAFLFCRLESLPQTQGRFRLNARLPIPFAGFGDMEVDFLCPDARLVIELDGPHHFADADAYRRDRKKDFLLQENGYRILRFLAEDSALRLDNLIDDILRALAKRR